MNQLPLIVLVDANHKPEEIIFFPGNPDTETETPDENKNLQSKLFATFL